MKILVANHHMKQIGGSETFTYTLIGELIRTGHEVDLFTLHPGIISRRVEEDFDVKNDQPCFPYNHYDLVLASHNTMVDYIYNSIRYNFLIQTCHGIYPSLEQPSPHADKYVSISKEVHDYLFESCGHKSFMIWNGVDCERFKPTTKPRKEIKTILSLMQSASANNMLRNICHDNNIKFIARNNSLKNTLWNIEDEFNKADLVVSLGRGAYEAMACGRPVLVFDARNYSKSYADGMMTSYNIAKAMENNCSGRSFRLDLDEEKLTDEIKKYRCEYGHNLRTFVLFNLNIKYQVLKYLEIYNEYINTHKY